MPMISFSMSLEKILDGSKRQTCRYPRIHPIKIGDPLFMYWKVRVPKAKKPMHFIGKSFCIDTEQLQYRQFAYDDHFARLDGFRDSVQLRDWFGPVAIQGKEIFDVIGWGEIIR